MGFSIKQQMKYCGARSKKGTKDRNGKPLSDFRRGEYLGKAKGMGSMVNLHKKQNVPKGNKEPEKEPEHSARYMDGYADGKTGDFNERVYWSNRDYRQGFHASYDQKKST